MSKRCKEKTYYHFPHVVGQFINLSCDKYDTRVIDTYIHIFF